MRCPCPALRHTTGSGSPSCTTLVEKLRRRLCGKTLRQCRLRQQLGLRWGPDCGGDAGTLSISGIPTGHGVWMRSKLAGCSSWRMGMPSRLRDGSVAYFPPRRTEAFSQGGSRTTRRYPSSGLPAYQHRKIWALHAQWFSMRWAKWSSTAGTHLLQNRDDDRVQRTERGKHLHAGATPGTSSPACAPAAQH